MSRKFLGYTTGLMATSSALKTPKLVKCEFNELPLGKIEITGVSGHNLSKIPRLPRAIITTEQFDGLPSDNVERARWALEQIGCKA